MKYNSGYIDYFYDNFAANVDGCGGSFLVWFCILQ